MEDPEAQKQSRCSLEANHQAAQPQRRILVKDNAAEFDSEDAANSVHQLFGFLWEYSEVFDAFSNNFLLSYCEE